MLTAQKKWANILRMQTASVPFKPIRSHPHEKSARFHALDEAAAKRWATSFTMQLLDLVEQPTGWRLAENVTLVVVRPDYIANVTLVELEWNLWSCTFKSWRRKR